MSIKTKIITDSEALGAVLSGAEQLYKAVSTTMGPRGQNVIFKKYGKKVGITHDGVTVAKMVKVDSSEAENLGAELLREAAMKQDATTGDGTTTVTVLAYHILKRASEDIKNGKSPMVLKLELESRLDNIISSINRHTNKEVGLKELVDVASVSSGSRDIGEKVAKVIFEAGKDTPILLGFSGTTDTISEVVNGFKIDSGAASPYLMDGSGVKVEIPNPKIIVVDAKLRDRDDVLPLLRLTAQIPDNERRFLLVCSDISGDALSYMVANRLKGFADIAVARVPQHINSHAEYLSDVAISCGAKVLSRNTGNTIREPKLAHFGSADKVTVEPRETVIVNGHPIVEDLDHHRNTLENFKKESKLPAARKFAQDRLYALEQKIVGIYVGGQSETDAEERHYRYEDAVGACKAALRGGVVPGGGTLLYSIGKSEIKSGNSILGQALQEPLKKVLDNSGVDYTNLDIEVGKGIDVLNPSEGIVDLTKKGILDPAESEIECVKTAVTIAGLLMTSGALIVDEGEVDETSEQIIAGSSSTA